MDKSGRDGSEFAQIDWVRTDHLIELALAEDLDVIGDATTLSVVPEDIECRAVLRCKADDMVVAGLPVAERVFKLVDSRLDFKNFCQDGDKCRKGDLLAEITGPARGLLTAERTALNFIQRLSGIATASARCAEIAASAGTKTRILDTRKTTPGYRNLEKYAVSVGGCTNHRIGLYDMVMIKDNHRELAASVHGGRAAGIRQAVEAARRRYPDLQIEVEADTLDEVREAIEAGANIVMLDNMDNPTMAEAVKIADGRVKLEASGGITHERILSIAEIGVDFISIGALTHSVKSADISLDFEVVS